MAMTTSAFPAGLNALTVVVAMAVAGAIGGAVGAELGSGPNDWPAEIVRRNPFGLRSVSAAVDPRVPLEMARTVRPVILLRGVADVTGRKLAFVESRRADGGTHRAIVTEGQTFAGVEVTSIDVGLARAGFRGFGDVWEVGLSPGESMGKPPALSPPHPGRGMIPPGLGGDSR